MVDCDYRNFAPLLVGPVGIVLGILAVGRSRGTRSPRPEVGIGLLCVAIGALHIARGLGLIELDITGGITGGSPC